MIIRPQIKADNKAVNTAICGSNNYFFEERFIEFVITGKSDCLVQVRLVNSVQVSTRLAMSPEDFLDGDTRTTFISRISAFLNIPTDKLKIVGIRTPTRRILAGTTTAATEVDVDFTVEKDPIGIPKDKGGSYDPAQQFI